jgi:transposase-like protein
MMTKKKRKQYPEDFKKRAVAMVLEGSMSLTEVAKQLDVPQPILSQWKLRNPGESDH